jgi:hypothetical protein
MIKKYANPHIVYFNSIIILENIINPSTSIRGRGRGGDWYENKDINV